MSRKGLDIVNATVEEHDPDYHAACCAAGVILTHDEYQDWLAKVKADGHADIRASLEDAK